MSSPPDSSMDDMLARATLQNYGDIGIVTIPGIEILSESEQIVAVKKAGQRLASSAPIEPHALRSRLRSITPPLDQEEDDAESRMFEAQARKDLESDGCPACYPPHLDVPVRNPPEEYKPIIDYWHSLASTGDVVLCAQRAGWQEFRAFQAGVRRRYPIFNTIIDDVRERRRRRGLGGVVNLIPDLKQQTRQQNWLEFQNYHLRQHERLEKKRDKLIAKVGSAHKNVGNMNTVVFEHAAGIERACLRSLEFTERTLRWHEVLLGWIEQQRLAMNPEPPTGIQEDSDNPNALSVASDAILLGNIPRQPKLRLTKGKPLALGPLRPQRVSKTKRLADAGVKSRLGTEPRRRPAPPRLDSGPGALKTRSGRVSRPPVRWAPE